MRYPSYTDFTLILLCFFYFNLMRLSSELLKMHLLRLCFAQLTVIVYLNHSLTCLFVGVLQILCYGLSLPLTDSDTIRDCVSIYCDWLTCLLTEPKSSVPLPIIEAPNEYVPALLSHLYNVFLPRLDGSECLFCSCHCVSRPFMLTAVFLWLFNFMVSFCESYLRITFYIWLKYA